MAKGVETKTIVGLEVGTSKVVAVVGEVFPGWCSECAWCRQLSFKSGLDRGSITDLVDAVVGSIQAIRTERSTIYGGLSDYECDFSHYWRPVKALMKVVLCR